jgi:hypothetical protein
MAIYTEATFNFSADPALITQSNQAMGQITQPYVDAGYCPQNPDYTPALPDDTWPPSSGTYVARKEWTDQTQAEFCVAQIQSWLNSNPACKAYSNGPAVVVV